MKIKENTFLRHISELSGLEIKFKDENVLPGTAWIGNMPIDISIKNNSLILNSVGEFGGDAKQYTKSTNRGKGNFRKLVPHIVHALSENNMELKIYLTPLSPVWADDYKLMEYSSLPSMGHCWFLDLS